MEYIDIDTLTSEGYIEDLDAAKLWRRPYDFVLFAVAALVIVIGIWSIIFQTAWGFLMAILTASVGGISQLLMRLSHPRSRHTGRPMQKYRNRWISQQISTIDETTGEETVYVCHDSKTYFTHTFQFDSESNGGGD